MNLGTFRVSWLATKTSRSVCIHLRFRHCSRFCVRVIQVFRQIARNKLTIWGWLSTGLFFLKQLFTPSIPVTVNLPPIWWKTVNYFSNKIKIIASSDYPLNYFRWNHCVGGWLSDQFCFFQHWFQRVPWCPRLFPQQNALSPWNLQRKYLLWLSSDSRS